MAPAMTRWPSREALHRGAQLLDDADRLVADGQSLRDGVFALQDVNVGAADRGGRHPDQRVQRTDVGDRLVFEDDASLLDEDRRFHLAGHGSLQSLSAGARSAPPRRQTEDDPGLPPVVDRDQMYSKTSSMLPNRIDRVVVDPHHPAIVGRGVDLEDLGGHLAAEILADLVHLEDQLALAVDADQRRLVGDGDARLLGP